MKVNFKNYKICIMSNFQLLIGLVILLVLTFVGYTSHLFSLTSTIIIAGICILLCLGLFFLLKKVPKQDKKYRKD